jgi:hypothetical protein
MHNQPTNVEIITKMMEFSRRGAMAQIFIITAIDRYAREIIKNEERVLEQMEGSIIDGPAWVDTAKEIIEKLDEHYGGPRD